MIHVPVDLERNTRNVADRLQKNDDRKKLLKEKILSKKVSRFYIFIDVTWFIHHNSTCVECILLQKNILVFSTGKLY
jgi:hypothetical protein